MPLSAQNKQQTQFSLSGHIETQRSEMQIWIAQTRKRVHLNSINAAIFAFMMSPVSAWGAVYCAVMCLMAPLMQQHAIYFICILSQPSGFFDVTFCSGGCGQIRARHGRGPKPY